MKSRKSFRELLKNGRLAITAEFVPQASSSTNAVRKTASLLKDCVDAVSVADNMGARVGLSSLAISKMMLDSGIEPIMTLVTRDRNRIALQSDLLGAAALGIRSVFCTTGDHQRFGDHPGALNVFDIDSVQLINTAKRIRDEGMLLGGAKCEAAPFFIGAAADPFGEPADLMMLRLGQKVEAGADFIKTLPVFDAEKLEKWMEGVRKEGLNKKCAILACVAVPNGTESVRKTIPDNISHRLKGLTEKKRANEAAKICIEQIKAIKDIEGIKGIHIMAAGHESLIPEIVGGAGLK